MAADRSDPDRLGGYVGEVLAAIAEASGASGPRALTDDALRDLLLAVRRIEPPAEDAEYHARLVRSLEASVVNPPEAATTWLPVLEELLRRATDAGIALGRAEPGMAPEHELFAIDTDSPNWETRFRALLVERGHPDPEGAIRRVLDLRGGEDASA